MVEKNINCITILSKCVDANNSNCKLMLEIALKKSWVQISIMSLIFSCYKQKDKMDWRMNESISKHISMQI